MTDAALIIIDVQNDFCPGGALAVENGDAIIPVINRIAPEFRQVIATRDWHPEGHISFASRHPGKQPFEQITVDGLDQVLWPDHCIQASEGAAFHPDLDLRPVDLIVHKGTKKELDSYSALFENDHTTPTGLEGYLNRLGISTVYFTGLAADVCVFYSAMDAVKVKYKTFVIFDATRGVDQPAGNVERTKEEMLEAGVTFVESSEL